MMLGLKIFWAAAKPHLKYWAKIGGAICGWATGIGAAISLLALLISLISFGSFKLTWFLFAPLVSGSVETLSWIVGIVALIGGLIGAVIGFMFVTSEVMS